MLHRAGAGNRLGSVEVKPAEEHRQSAKQDAFGFGQQRVRPVHRGAQRLLAAHRGAGTTGQQPEPITQTVEDLGRRQRAHPRRRQLDRQRHPIQARANLAHRRGGVGAQREVGPGMAGAVDEQLDRLVGQ